MSNSVATLDNRNDAVAKEDPCATQNHISPEVNIFETKDGYILEAEMPGVSKEGLEIALESNTITIHGRRNQPEVKGSALYRESTKADYRRVFELDPAIDAAKIEAKINQGLLTVHLPKFEAVKPRKVTVSD